MAIGVRLPNVSVEGLEGAIDPPDLEVRARGVRLEANASAEAVTDIRVASIAT
ncbi:hypothetical protein [Rubidibacter lacunae]|uniref:hypothetical protein n=1 Tax=Rubidibacter lacunae TaxID=582514 RepID=UPI00040BA4EA|nr:hypothetical protein [Rubidibacter lacunae]